MDGLSFLDGAAELLVHSSLRGEHSRVLSSCCFACVLGCILFACTAARTALAHGHTYSENSLGSRIIGARFLSPKRIGNVWIFALDRDSNILVCASPSWPFAGLITLAITSSTVYMVLFACPLLPSQHMYFAASLGGLILGVQLKASYMDPGYVLDSGANDGSTPKRAEMTNGSDDEAVVASEPCCCCCCFPWQLCPSLNKASEAADEMDDEEREIEATYGVASFALKRAAAQKCKDCNLLQPFGAAHCEGCGLCVTNHHHHCCFLGCVGERNILFVYAFQALLLGVLPYGFWLFWTYVGVVRPEWQTTQLGRFLAAILVIPAALGLVSTYIVMCLRTRCPKPPHASE